MKTKKWLSIQSKHRNETKNDKNRKRNPQLNRRNGGNGGNKDRQTTHNRIITEPITESIDETIHLR